VCTSVLTQHPPFLAPFKAKGLTADLKCEAAGQARCNRRYLTVNVALPLVSQQPGREAGVLPILEGGGGEPVDLVTMAGVAMPPEAKVWAQELLPATTGEHVEQKA
jgi:hypothetical protein